MEQTWRDLLFAHWPLAPAALRPLLPESLALDTFDGRAWLGITPFEVRPLRPRGLPALQGFPELNVRTYATLDGKQGIWFFSLDAASILAVLGARATYFLPYFRARMQIERGETEIRYRSARRSAKFAAAYAPTGPPAAAAPGTLEHFLTERYCLYTRLGPRILRSEIHHPPWPLQAARASFAVNSMAPVALPARAPLLHFARRQDVLIWRPRRAYR